MRAIVFDYGAGNLHSLGRALAAVGAQVEVETDARRAVQPGAVLVLPGVGAFGPAAQRLEPGREAVRRALRDGHPCLGICLGMQLLFEGSEEGPGAGLALLEGRVTRLRAARVPHIGWAALQDGPEGPGQAPHRYFAHTYACRPVDASCVQAWCRLDDDTFPAMVRTGRTVGVQFHPEKSSAPGLALLKDILEELR